MENSAPTSCFTAVGGGNGGNMLIADIGLVANAMTVLNAPPDLIEEVVSLLQSNSEDLNSQVVTEVGPGWFGGSANGHRQPEAGARRVLLARHR